MTLHIQTNRRRARLARFIGAASVCLFASTPLIATAQRPIADEPNADAAYGNQFGDPSVERSRQFRSIPTYTPSSPTLYQDRLGRQFYMDDRGTRFYADQPRAIQPGNTGTWQSNRGRIVRPMGDQYAGSQTTQSSRPMLGIGISDADEGVRVDAVQSNSVAAQAGLQPGDTITAVNGKEIRNTQQLQGMINQDIAGQELPMTVLRDGNSTQLTASFPNSNASQQQGAYSAAKPAMDDSNLQQLRSQVEQLQQQVDRLSEEVGIETTDQAQDQAEPQSDRGSQEEGRQKNEGDEQKAQQEQQSSDSQSERQQGDQNQSDSDQSNDAQNKSDDSKADQNSDNDQSNKSDNSES